MKPSIAIVGSGVVGSTLAYELTKVGYTVDVFERGRENEYPHIKQFEADQLAQVGPGAADWDERFEVPKDVRPITQEGDYAPKLQGEQITIVGGKAAYWGAMTPRMAAKDFKTKSLFRYGHDWPVSYDELEPYYCGAEALLSVSGNDSDNPFAPKRSKPYPLPAFELGYAAKLFAERLRQKGIALGRHPQARTRVAADGRPACANFGTCGYCPIGARYSPVMHLDRARATKLCTVHTRTSVRRILVDAEGKARGLLYQEENARQPVEHAASLVIMAGGPIESVRLLLLSTDARNQGGLGNHTGQVGKNYFMHHTSNLHAEYKDPLYSARTWTGHGVSYQFVDSPERGKLGGFKVNHWDSFGRPHPPKDNGIFDKAFGGKELISGREVMEALSDRTRCAAFGFDAEVVPGPEKYVSLSKTKDRFGDRAAHVHYTFNDFDRANLHAGEALLDRFIAATGGTRTDRSKLGVESGHHHLGGLRMGDDEREAVVDKLGRVYGTSNLFVVGGATFPSFSAVNPTLTMVAMALRTVDIIQDQYK